MVSGLSSWLCVHCDDCPAEVRFSEAVIGSRSPSANNMPFGWPLGPLWETMTKLPGWRGTRADLSGGNGERRARVRDKGHLPDADRCLICLLCVVYVLLHYSFHARVDPSIQLKFVVKSCEIPLWHWKFVGSHQKCTPGVSYMTIDRAHPYEPCI